jgi:periplasmic mercuric ion binding protein
MKKIRGFFVFLAGLSMMMAGIGAVFAQDKKIATVEIQTSAVCGMCKDRLERGLAFEKGVKDVALNDSTKILTVKYLIRSTNPDVLRRKVSKLGYDADDVSADKAAYDKLPACCKKGVPLH